MGAYATRGDDELLLVHITEGGGEQSLTQILDTLSAEIADREQILTVEERRERVAPDAHVGLLPDRNQPAIARQQIPDHRERKIDQEIRCRMNRCDLKNPGCNR